MNVLMAVAPNGGIAGAKVIMRNMYNGTMTATFPDNSKAYIDPVYRTVVASD